MSQSNQGLLSPFLRGQRMGAARPHVNGRLLDIGCGDGALSQYASAEDYYGYDISESAVAEAKKQRPDYTFSESVPPENLQFDTIAALAVIEHVNDPADFIREWGSWLKPGGRMILTTPHPAFEWAHELGSKIGLFSHDAAEEHETLIDSKSMKEIAEAAGYKVAHEKRFLFGVNQLFVLEHG